MNFPIRDVHQVEITSRCNLRCKYCVHPTMPRAKMDMSQEHYDLSLRWAAYFKARGTQGELNLCGIGESTLHPQFVPWLFKARETLGEGWPITFTTNGLEVDDALARAIAPAKPAVYVSLHRPEKAGPAVEALKRYGLLVGVSNDPALASTNWAGQVDWFVSAAKGRPCIWVKPGRAFVMADGRVSRCCYDGSGIGVLGTIEQDLSVMRTSPYALCANCEQDVGVTLTKEAAA